MVTNLAEGHGPAVAPASPLHAVVSGAGRPVLLLHGLFGMGSNLGALARSLAERFEVHQLDLPNHGRSPWVDRMDLASLADAVAVYGRDLAGGAHVVGHSLGGKVAMQLALRHPGIVRSLVVADIAPVAYGARHDRVFAAIADVAAREPRSRGEAGAVMGSWLEDAGVIQFLLLSLRRDSDGVYRWRFNGDGLKAGYEAIREAPEGGTYGGRALFLYGGRSDYVTNQGIGAARAVFTAATFECMEDAGHWLHAEQPQAFNAAVGEFLDSVEQSAP